jgi:hypothetical protein
MRPREGRLRETESQGQESQPWETINLGECLQDYVNKEILGPRNGAWWGILEMRQARV